MPTPPAPIPSAATSDPPKKLPGLAGIWIGILLVVGGIVLGIVLVVVGAKSLVNGIGDLQRVDISTGGAVYIDSAGEQNIYAERYTGQSGSSVNSGSYTSYRPNITVTVTDPQGNPVNVSQPGSSETYVSNGREGIRLAAFFADEEGQYHVKAVASDGASAYDSIAVGDAFDLGGLAGIAGGVFGGGLVVIVGIVVIIIFSVRRGRARRRLALAGFPGGYNPAGGQLPGWAPAPVPGPMYPQAGGGYPPGSAPGWPPAAPAYPPASSPTPGWAPPPVPMPTEPSGPLDPTSTGSPWNPPPAPGGSAPDPAADPQGPAS